MTGKGARVAVIGGGPAGLMAAEVLAQGGVHVTVYDRMPSLGRKLLLAGRGGLNLTHSEDLARFMPRYAAAARHLQTCIEAFPPDALRNWAHELGQETFVGSSGRVFPKAMKASPLLRAWLRRLAAQGVEVRLRQRWRGWDDAGQPVFEGPEEAARAKYDAVVLALGGASWPNLGSDGGWMAPLEAAGVKLASLHPANCGFLIEWSEIFRDAYAGRPLKRLGLRCGPAAVRGEALITMHGIEGGGVYALSALLRQEILRHGHAELVLDLRPDETAEALLSRFPDARGKQSLSNSLRKTLSLAPVEIGLLHEATLREGRKLTALSRAEVVSLIKAVPLKLNGMAPMARAISTAGGVTFDAVDDHFMLKALPGVFVAGEMLDWEAPTGGYLLQACFATGAAAGRGALNWLAANGPTGHHRPPDRTD